MNKLKDKELKKANGGYTKETESIYRPPIYFGKKPIPGHVIETDYYTFDIGDCFINGSDKYKVTSNYSRVAWHIMIDCEHINSSGASSPTQVQALTLASYEYVGNNNNL